MRLGTSLVIFGLKLSLLWFLIVAAVTVLATWWVFSDARRRNFSPWFWALITFIFFPLGLIIYLIYVAIVARAKV